MFIVQTSPTIGRFYICFEKKKKSLHSNVVVKGMIIQFKLPKTRDIHLLSGSASGLEVDVRKKLRFEQHNYLKKTNYLLYLTWKNTDLHIKRP